jgi:hypothetical protein
VKKVSSSKSLFIKLGSGGMWEEESIKNSILRLGYNEADFTACNRKNWKKIEDDYLQLGKSQIATSGYITQIKYFFEEPEDTIWITFYNNKLWWTKAKKEITLLEDGTKVRDCLDKWSDKNILGETLFMENISGKLLKTQGFRGTICTVDQHEYLLRKINAEMSEEVQGTKSIYNDLKLKLSLLIKELTWQDFEVLIDLIFTQAGWQRVSSVGKTAKTLDLDLKAPVTGEKCLVQIKSSSNNKELSLYLETFEKMDQYDRFYYICHTFKDIPPDLSNKANLNLMFVDQVAELAIDSGLTKWIISKVS